MADGSAKAQQQAVGKLYAFIIGKMKTGADQGAIIQELAAQGMDRADAAHAVETIYPKVLKAAREQAYTPGALTPALAGGLGAAAAGGLVWAWLVILTGWEIGYVAWGLGWLAGYAVVKLTGGKRGRVLQAVAAGSAVLGIAIGKYLIFWHTIKELASQQMGKDVAAGVSPLSGELIRLFAEHFTSMLSGFDAVWVLLAVGTAWAIPRGLGIKPPAR
ncbi:MAG TPA: hypothetical protein VGB20_07255 [bacterium]